MSNNTYATNYAGVDLTRHPALREAYRIACLIEACGASPELTAASCAAFDFIRALNEDVRELERLSARVASLESCLRGVASCSTCAACREAAENRLATETVTHVKEMTMEDKQIEQEIQAKGLTAPRVTPDRIEAVIASEWYFNAAEAVTPDAFQPPVPAQHPLRLLTFCVLVLKNGFTVTGESACASPANFDAELGKKIARKHATGKIWALEGYLLREKLSA